MLCDGIGKKQALREVFAITLREMERNFKNSSNMSRFKVFIRSFLMFSGE